MIERVTKKIYLFFKNHFRFMTWYLYISPIVGVVSCNDFVFKIILYIDVILCIVLQIGNMKQWNKGVQ